MLRHNGTFLPNPGDTNAGCLGLQQTINIEEFENFSVLKRESNWEGGHKLGLMSEIHQYQSV